MRYEVAQEVEEVQVNLRLLRLDEMTAESIAPDKARTEEPVGRDERIDGCTESLRSRRGDAKAAVTLRPSFFWRCLSTQ